MKRIFLFLLLCCFALPLVPSPSRLPARAEARKANVYILAGQSNAVGCSSLDQTIYGGEGSYRALLEQADPRNRDGYEHVYAYSAVNVAANAPLPDPELRPVQMGMGQSSAYIGPELGMAHMLSEQASAETPCVIIKLAAGGVFLGDYDGTASAYNFTGIYGNWASPTMIARWQQEGKRIHRNTGLLYERLLGFVEQAFGKLRAQGYQPVVRGYAWMQGESDSEDDRLATAYAQNLTEFIGDLRGDIAALAQSEDAAYAPFVIGKVTPTYNYIVRAISKLRAGQELAAASVPFAYTVETEDLPVFDIDAKAVCGSDICHFNAADIYTLGQRFASSLREHTALYHLYVRVEGEGGSIAEHNHLSNGEPFHIAYTTREDAVLAHALLDGQELKVTGDVIELSPAAGDAAYRFLTLSFAPRPSSDADEPQNSGFPPALAIALTAGGMLLAAAGVLAVLLLRRRRR